MIFWSHGHQYGTSHCQSVSAWWCSLDVELPFRRLGSWNLITTRDDCLNADCKTFSSKCVRDDVYRCEFSDHFSTYKSGQLWTWNSNYLPGETSAIRVVSLENKSLSNEHTYIYIFMWLKRIHEEHLGRPHETALFKRMCKKRNITPNVQTGIYLASGAFPTKRRLNMSPLYFTWLRLRYVNNHNPQY